MPHITIDAAYRLRFLRGLETPYIEGVTYENDRLEYIIKRQYELSKEMQELDKELILMYKAWESDMLEQERIKDKRKANFDRF